MTTNNGNVYVNEDEEINDLFYLLAGEQCGQVRTARLIFGLENYGLPLSSEVIKSLKFEIEKKQSSDNTISLEDFKSLWNSKCKTGLNPKELSGHFWNILMDMINKDKQINSDEATSKNDDDIHVPNISQESLNADDLTNLFKLLEIEAIDNSSNKKKTLEGNDRKTTNNKQPIDLNSITRGMIENIDLDGSKSISLKEFEFVVSEYLNSLKKNK